MPELPEVETTRRGLVPFLVGRVVRSVVLRVPKLRRPLPQNLPDILTGERLLAVERRAKYLLLRFPAGALLVHLGMSGHLRLVPAVTPPERHDHVDLTFDDGTALRFNDSRRFGTLVWTTDDPLRHRLLAHLGPEPLEGGWDGEYLARLARGRKLSVKAFIMDQSVLAGVGNIYANEALFRAGIRPQTPAGQLRPLQWQTLREAIGAVMADAVAAGEASLHDIRETGGRLGYFRIRPKVYGRDGEPCPRCGRPLLLERVGQRSTYYCSHCQR